MYFIVAPCSTSVPQLSCSLAAAVRRTGGSLRRTAARAAVIQLQRRTTLDRVADVGDLGRLDHPRRGELDPLVVGECEAGVEQALSVAEQHRGDVQLELVEQPALDHLSQQRAATGDRHLLAT